MLPSSFCAQKHKESLHKVPCGFGQRLDEESTWRLFGHETGDHKFQFSQDMEELFSSDDVFNGLDSAYEQRSYFLKNFNLVVHCYFQGVKITPEKGVSKKGSK
jgi:hypothetical protein